MNENFYNENEEVSLSSKSIAHWVATNSNIALLLQYSVDYKPGLMSRSRNSGFANSIASIAPIYDPISELAKRGVLVERGLIDMDEIDMGWIIGKALEDESNWRSGTALNTGRIFLFAPIAVSAGYVLSEMDDFNQPLDITLLIDTARIIIENTTPEDTVNIYNTIYEMDSFLSSKILNNDESLHELVEEILNDELNLFDFYDKNQNKYLIFDVISKNYEHVINKGLPAFLEVINEGYSPVEGITHSYITLLSQYIDTQVFDEFGRITAQKIQRDALEIVEYGGYLTEKGRKMIQEMDQKLDRYDNHISPQTIDDITSTTTFIGTLLGIRP